MAVVQISKIQVRRGQKNSNSGIPQLSSAEFAWAVDSQELFIGNGSVLEGAPYVGNTKILTEHDNILDLASSYQFASTDTSISLSVPRSLQSKLDEYVSVTDFGAVGDGSTDCVTAFETAFEQLFRNVNTNYRKVLMIPNGEYLFSSDLAIPSGVILQGETQLGVVLNIGDNNIRFVTSTGLELASFNSSNRPQNIKISNLTIQRNQGQTVLSGVANSIIEDVKFLGEYQFGNSVTLSTAPAAVFWENILDGTKVNNLKFKNCLFESNSVAIRCNQTNVYDTEIKFENTKFFVSDTAIYVVGVTGQGNKWQINDCEFEEIANQAFRSTAGQGTIIQRSKFKKVGNTTNLSSIPNDYMVYFGEKIGNVVLDCTSDRQQAAGVTSSNLTVSYPEVYNADKVSFIDRNYSLIYPSDGFTPLAVFSATNKFTIINYCLKMAGHTRHGQLWIAIGDDLAGTELDDPLDLNGPGEGSLVTITDNFQYSPQLIANEGGALMTNLEFGIALRDNDTDSGIETLVLSYKNPLPGATGSISFDVAYGV
jgi:hypothetical protein